MRLEEFNALGENDACAALLTCCDAPAWAGAVSHGRPYGDREALQAAGDRAARTLTRGDIDRALAAHPRIGQTARVEGGHPAWSRQEQAGVGGAPTTLAELAEANRAYEQRFGRVFLICASGLSGDRILARLRERLGNDEHTEEEMVAEELRKIALLRLDKMVDP